MASEKKIETPKTETPKHAGSDVMVDPNEGVMHLERIAVALERLANAFAPVRPGTAAGRPLARTCDQGHGMQPTDDYCQTCKAAEKNAAIYEPAA